MLGFKTGTAPYQNHDRPITPLAMLLSYGAGWAGQAYAGHPHQLSEMIVEAIAQRGFSYLHILSPCVTIDKTSMTHERLELALREVPGEHDRQDLVAAPALARDTATPALGLYDREARPTLSDLLDAIIAAAGAAPPAHRRPALKSA